MDGCEIHPEIYRKFAVELQFVDQMIVMNLSLDSVYLARNRVRRTFFIFTSKIEKSLAIFRNYSKI